MRRAYIYPTDRYEGRRTNAPGFYVVLRDGNAGTTRTAWSLGEAEKVKREWEDDLSGAISTPTRPRPHRDALRPAYEDTPLPASTEKKKSQAPRKRKSNKPVPTNVYLIIAYVPDGADFEPGALRWTKMGNTSKKGRHAEVKRNGHSVRRGAWRRLPSKRMAEKFERIAHDEFARVSEDWFQAAANESFLPRFAMQADEETIARIAMLAEHSMEYAADKLGL